MNIEYKIRDISRNYYRCLMNIKNVKGIGLGYRMINGVNTFEPCIHVLVSNKIDSRYISCRNVIPKTYMGIKTDVIDLGESNKIVNQSSNLDKKIRPLQGGYSISAYDSEYVFGNGTITCIVKKKGVFSTDYYILSNYHVLVKGKKKLNVMQPAISGGGTVKDKVGVTTDFVPIKTSSSYSNSINYVDCAIAKINKSLASNLIAEVGKVKGVGNASLGDKVKKIGKTTGKTEGVITTLGATIKVVEDGNKIFFKDQMLASTSSAPGDSGSPLLNENNEIIGLLMGGSSGEKTSFNDIKMVLKLLKVELYI